MLIMILRPNNQNLFHKESALKELLNGTLYDHFVESLYVKP